MKTFLDKCKDAYYNTENFYVVSDEDEKLLSENGFQIASGTQVTDAIFDMIQRKVAEQDKSVMNVGSPVRGAKIKLPIPLGSMEECHEGELGAWVNTDLAYVLSAKLDGCSCLVHYQDGKLDKAYSRGDGVEGQDITYMLQHMKHVKQTLEESFTGYVRGELIIPKSQFMTVITLFKNELNKIYKNARNLVAGQVNAIKPDKIYLDNTHFVCYYIDDFAGNKLEMFDKIKELGIEVANYTITPGSIATEKNMQMIIQSLKENYDYECDGIILTVKDDFPVFHGFETGTLNPKDSRKYKVGANETAVETVVKGIIWQIGKSGTLAPVVFFDTVHLDGVDINFASGHSYQQMVDMGIGVGSRVIVSRHGSVIPEVDSCLDKIGLQMENNLPIAHIKCIDAEGRISFVKADVAVVGAYLKYVGNDLAILRELRIQQLVYFGSEMGLEYFGEGNVRALLNAYPMLNIESLIKLSEESFTDVIGTNGSKIYYSMKHALSKATPAKFYSAVDALGEASGIGEKKLQALFDVYDTLDLTMDQILSVSGWAEKSAKKLLESKESINHWSTFLIENNIKLASSKVAVVSSKCAGLEVCFTGVRDSNMEEFIKSNGGKIASSVTKTCNLLVADNINGTSGKITKAKEKGIKLISYDDALKIFV